jgi:hypothetical protein
MTHVTTRRPTLLGQVRMPGSFLESMGGRQFLTSAEAPETAMIFISRLLSALARAIRW